VLNILQEMLANFIILDVFQNMLNVRKNLIINVKALIINNALFTPLSMDVLNLGQRFLVVVG
jgi:hypothetical protein